MKEKKIAVIIFLAIAVISIVIVIIQIKRNRDKEEFGNNAKTTIATVEEVKSRNVIKIRRRNRRYRFLQREYIAFVSYQVDGEDYYYVKVKGGYGMEPGSQMEVYYLPEDPGNAKSIDDLQKNYSIFLYFVPILSGLFAYGVYTDKIKLKNEREEYI